VCNFYVKTASGSKEKTSGITLFATYCRSTAGVNSEISLKLQQHCLQTIPTCSGVGGWGGGPGVCTRAAQWVHAKCKNPVRIFFVEGGRVGSRQPLMTNSPGLPLNLQTRLRRCLLLLAKLVNTSLFTAQCTLVHLRGLGIACRPSVCL